MTPLTPTRWRRVNDLFHAAVDLPAQQRAPFLERACADDPDLRREVESLLFADSDASSDHAFSAIVGAALQSVSQAATPLTALQRVGPYRILREIGEGGMATVFLAVRDDDEFNQRVAIKVVRGALSGEALRRFRAERQILASLEHPSIARLLDGGTTPEGLPYLVMEYVAGVPIDRYCHDAQLSIRDRLQLFGRVCDAVDHAHRSLVVHRDIKPSNILVTDEGTPKLLDFGIAKLLDDNDSGTPVTLTGLRALTPEYASPEQIRGEPITTASDVYSLGVLLYELLTGTRPLAFAARQPSEIERVVCTIEPRRPSSTVASPRQARELAGDLDTIALTALQKEPARRYDSAARLAEDIRRHLDGIPVLARPSTWRYRSSRFVRRHRTGVAAAMVFAFVVFGFAIALAIQIRGVARERDTAEQVTNLLLALYSSFDPIESGGGRVTPQEVLDRGALRIQTEFTDQPQLQARMLDAIGSLYSSIGVPDRAEAVLKQSLAIREGSSGIETREAARTLLRLANAHRERARFADAEAYARRALDIHRRLVGRRAAETGESLTTLGPILYLLGRHIEGEAVLVEGIQILRDTRGADSPEFQSALMNLARFWRERLDFQPADRFARADLLKAERFERERLAVRRKAFGDAHTLTTNSLSLLGLLLRAMGRAQEAEPLLREALALRRQVFGRDDHLSVIEAQTNLALTMHDLGRLDEAEPLYRSSVRRLRTLLGSHPQLAVDLTNLGTVLEESGRVEEAESAYREALWRRQALAEPERATAARTLDHLAVLLHQQRRQQEALAAVDEAIALRRQVFGDTHPETLASLQLRSVIVDPTKTSR